jgi:hypothetical protein
MNKIYIIKTIEKTNLNKEKYLFELVKLLNCFVVNIYYKNEYINNSQKQFKTLLEAEEYLKVREV